MKQIAQALAIATGVALVIGLTVFVVGEFVASDPMARIGALMTLPATGAFALMVLAVVVGYLLVLVITASLALLSAWRRCTRR